MIHLEPDIYTKTGRELLDDKTVEYFREIRSAEYQRVLTYKLSEYTRAEWMVCLYEKVLLEQCIPYFSKELDLNPLKPGLFSKGEVLYRVTLIDKPFWNSHTDWYDHFRTIIQEVLNMSEEELAKVGIREEYVEPYIKAYRDFLRGKMDFTSFVNDIERNGWNVFGTEVYENGRLIHAWGDTQDDIHEIYSATKAVVSVAFGIMYDRGLIGLDDPILKYIPSPAKPGWNKVTIRRLLTMSLSNLPFRAEGDNWIRFSLDCDINPEDKGFNYSNICTYLVGVALANILGSDLGRFIEDEIFKPLNIEKYEYSRSPEGYFYSASGMKLSVHDLSKFGLLLMNGGTYEGRRIVSEEYVKLATSVQQMNREGGYGFYIWKYRDGYSINGKWKQKCYILPERGIIVTYLSHIEDDSKELLQSMEKNILGID